MPLKKKEATFKGIHFGLKRKPFLLLRIFFYWNRKVNKKINELQSYDDPKQKENTSTLFSGKVKITKNCFKTHLTRMELLNTLEF